VVVHPGRGLSTARRLRVKKLWNLKAVGRLLAHGFFSSKRSWDRLALTAFFFNIENLVLPRVAGSSKGKVRVERLCR